MASNGVISLISGNKVVMKIIAASGGENITEAVSVIRKNWPINIFRAYDIALNLQFGSSDSLVVMDIKKIYYLGPGSLTDKYRKTFNAPRFNPYNKKGGDSYTVIIDIDVVPD